MEVPLIVIVPAIPVPAVLMLLPATVVVPTSASTLVELLMRLMAAALAIALPELDAYEYIFNDNTHTMFQLKYLDKAFFEKMEKSMDKIGQNIS